MKILVINGPNINFLGKREPEIYGDIDYDKLCCEIELEAKNLGIEVDIKQSNIEGEIVDMLQQTDGVYDGVIINPAAYTHYSIAILDAIKAISIPVVEVHLTNIHAREEYRRNAYTTSACIGQICGFSIDSYLIALRAIINYLK